MTHSIFASSRRLLISAALASLAVLGGCGTGNSDQAKPAAETANLNSADGTGMAPITDGGIASLQGKMDQVGDRVRFELDSYALTPDAEATLQKQAALLQEYQQAVVTIEGHADERGTREYNLALGERRADTVRNYLIALGVNADRISVVSFGKERPECADADENCWALNRRGVTVASQ